MANFRSRDEDAFIDEDIGYPNRRSQYRGFRFILWFMLGAGIIALLIGFMESGKEVLGAFPTSASLLERAAWGKFFAGFGTIAEIGLAVVLLALFWCWRRRRSAARRRKQVVT